MGYLVQIPEFLTNYKLSEEQSEVLEKWASLDIEEYVTQMYPRSNPLRVCGLIWEELLYVTDNLPNRPTNMNWWMRSMEDVRDEMNEEEFAAILVPALQQARFNLETNGWLKRI